jgi:hypothetical protein
MEKCDKLLLVGGDNRMEGKRFGVVGKRGLVSLSSVTFA